MVDLNSLVSSSLKSKFADCHKVLQVLQTHSMHAVCRLLLLPVFHGSLTDPEWIPKPIPPRPCYAPADSFSMHVLCWLRMTLKACMVWYFWRAFNMKLKGIRQISPRPCWAPLHRLFHACCLLAACQGFHRMSRPTPPSFC